MCRNCYITTFSALSPGTEFHPSSPSSNRCKNYNYNTSRTSTRPSKAAAVQPSSASVFSQDTTYSYDKEPADVTEKSKKRSMSNRLKSAFK